MLSSPESRAICLFCGQRFADTANLSRFCPKSGVRHTELFSASPPPKTQPRCVECNDASTPFCSATGRRHAETVPPVAAAASTSPSNLHVSPSPSSSTRSSNQFTSKSRARYQQLLQLQQRGGDATPSSSPHHAPPVTDNRNVSASDKEDAEDQCPKLFKVQMKEQFAGLDLPPPSPQEQQHHHHQLKSSGLVSSAPPTPPSSHRSSDVFDETRAYVESRIHHQQQHQHQHFQQPQQDRRPHMMVGDADSVASTARTTDSSSIPRLGRVDAFGVFSSAAAADEYKKSEATTSQQSKPRSAVVPPPKKRQQSEAERALFEATSQQQDKVESLTKLYRLYESEKQDDRELMSRNEDGNEDDDDDDGKLAAVNESMMRLAEKQRAQHIASNVLDVSKQQQQQLNLGDKGEDLIDRLVQRNADAVNAAAPKKRLGGGTGAFISAPRSSGGALGHVVSPTWRDDVKPKGFARAIEAAKRGALFFCVIAIFFLAMRFVVSSPAKAKFSYEKHAKIKIPEKKKKNGDL